MMKALTEFLSAGLKTEQPTKATPQGGDGGTQQFAETMEALLGSTTGGFKKLTSMNELTDSGLDEITVSADSELMMGDFTMDITKPGQDAPKGTQDTAASLMDSAGVVEALSGLSEESGSPSNFQEAINDLTGSTIPSQLVVTNDLADPQGMPASTVFRLDGDAVPTEITLNMVEAGRKFARHLSETPNNAVTVTSTTPSTSSANPGAVATPEVVGADNSLTRTEGVVRSAELFGVAERLPVIQSTERPSVDPRLEAATDRAAVASSATVAKVDLTARQTASFDTSIKLSNTEPQQFAGEMATHVRVLKSQSGGEVKLNLHPAELGRMSISVSTEGNETRVAFVVETSQARQAVETALPRLRDMLEDAGLSLSDSDVSEQRDPQAGADEKGPGSSRGETATPDSDDVSATTVLSVKMDPDRLVDTYI